MWNDIRCVMPSPRLITASLAGFMLAFACLVGADIADSDVSSLPQMPLPAPDFDVRMNGYASVSGSYELDVDVPARSADLDRALSDDGPTVPCSISIATVTEKGPVTLTRSTLRAVGSYAAGHTILYRSDRFHLIRGDFTIEIRNEGCSPAHQFQGGMAYLNRPAPVTIGIWFIVRLLGYASGLVGLLLLACAPVAGLLRSRRTQMPPI
jgi:hypothetical protein